MAIQIRFATADDAPQIVSLFHDTIHTVNARDYTPEQLAAWSPHLAEPDAWIAKRYPTHITFVADAAGTIAGFGELQTDGHVDCFYCHRDYQRQGVGRAIYTAIEQHARELAIARLYVEASITARPFFAAQGFTLVKEQTVVVRGIGLTNFVMEKRLAQPAS